MFSLTGCLFSLIRAALNGCPSDPFCEQGVLFQCFTGYISGGLRSRAAVNLQQSERAAPLCVRYNAADSRWAFVARLHRCHLPKICICVGGRRQASQRSNCTSDGRAAPRAFKNMFATPAAAPASCGGYMMYEQIVADRKLP